MPVMIPTKRIKVVMYIIIAFLNDWRTCVKGRGALKLQD